ncbi:putative glycosyltransferase [Kineosphaera limosa NBRC 100340]|uniref:D-inositol-3-phosphate glycosyltransferase n=2 Tax=Kineosphaera TaxID=211469 RepID=K6WUT8_9MICO|nr:putative glycosyltransferase [Kineosphaera limosa NBRC 100340]
MVAHGTVITDDTTDDTTIGDEPDAPRLGEPSAPAPPQHPDPAGAGEPGPRIERIAMLTVHTSPLDPPGSGDAGGLNVYVVEVARRLAQRGIAVEIFTRATTASLPETVELSPGVLVRHVVAGPYEGLGKEDLPGQLCAFTAGVMRAVAAHPEGHYDLVHSHYWLSGQVGWLAAERWGVPLVHTMHTMARVKNRSLAAGDRPEPRTREIGEAQVVAEADRLIANTDIEARELIELYDADPQRVAIVPPGVDLDLFTPKADALHPQGPSQAQARAAVGLAQDELVVLFVGRIQPLKAPDLLVRAAARLLAEARAATPGQHDTPGQHEQQQPDQTRLQEVARRLRVVILGGPSGSGLEHPHALADLAQELGVADRVRFVKPVPRAQLADWYRAADVVAVPSHSESFGLVALEAQACGTPVVAAAVGGLTKAVGGGVLLPDHDEQTWARALASLLADPDERARLGDLAVQHAAGFGWPATAEHLVDVYREAVAHRRAAAAV